MSYLHCGGCGSAYSMARLVACPRCGLRPGTPADPIEAVIAAAEQLASAMAGVTSSQLVAAELALDERGPGRSSILRTLRVAATPVYPVPAVGQTAGRAQLALLTTAVLALLARIPRRGWIARTLLR